MAAVSHLENRFCNDLSYGAEQHIFSGVFRVKESIFDVNFIIRALIGPEVQNGCQFGHLQITRFQLHSHTLAVRFAF